jgi:hypothetical protein
MEQPKLPTLVVAGGPHDGTAVVIDGPAAEKILGSGGTCHARFAAANVAPAHARVTWEDRGIVVSDAGSETGTYVNGERIGDDQVLNDGDRLFLGPPGSKDTVKFLVMIPADALSSGPVAITLAPSEEPEQEPIVLDTDSEPLILEPETPREPAAAPQSTSAVRAAGPEPPVASPVRLPEPPPAAPARPSSVAPRPTPPPPPPAAPTPARAETPGPAAGAATRRPAKPEYTTEPPSIAADRPREAPPPPIATPRRAPPRKRRSLSLPQLNLPQLPPAAWIGIGVVAVAGAGFFVYRGMKSPPPVVTSVTPARVEPGQVVTVVGTDFASTPPANTVRIGDLAGQVTGATHTQLTVVVPQALAARAPADVPLVVETGGGRSSPKTVSVFVTPKVTSLEPDVALPGEEVVAKGQHFGGSALSVQVDGVTAPVLESGATSVRFRVPEELPATVGKNVNVVVSTGRESTKPARLVIGRLPMLIDVTPVGGVAGTRVTLKGRGFDPDPAANVVRFAGRPALVLQGSATELVVSAPGLSGSQSQDVSEIAVQVRGTWTNAVAFTLSRPSSQAYSPRYFAAPVTDHSGHDHVFVANELGPVFLLTGKADAPSTAERAVRVAEAVNNLLSGVTSHGPFPLEVHDSPAPTVTGPGGKAAIVTATPEDGAGYDEPWLGGKPSRRGAATPKAVAAYWRALLQDHIALFRQGQRPYQVLELSPRGRVLRDLHVEARRGSSSGLLPISAIPLSEIQTKALRELALSLPAGDNVAAGAAVEGLWEGTTDDESGSRPVRVRLRLDGSSRLVGSLTSRVGKLSVEAALSDVAYDKGVLRFVMARGGAPRQFLGTVEGSGITGTIHSAPGAKEAVGRFKLHFVE